MSCDHSCELIDLSLVINCSQVTTENVQIYLHQCSGKYFKQLKLAKETHSSIKYNSISSAPSTCYTLSCIIHCPTFLVIVFSFPPSPGTFSQMYMLWAPVDHSLLLLPLFSLPPAPGTYFYLPPAPVTCSPCPFSREGFCP